MKLDPNVMYSRTGHFSALDQETGVYRTTYWLRGGLKSALVLCKYRVTEQGNAAVKCRTITTLDRLIKRLKTLSMRERRMDNATGIWTLYQSRHRQSSSFNIFDVEIFKILVLFNDALWLSLAEKCTNFLFRKLKESY